jgi:SAM-dependent methyltransferase
MITPSELKVLYAQGKNISSFLRDEGGTQFNTEEIIEITYDLQTGTYIAALEDEARATRHREYTEEIAKTILSLCRPTSILEAGVGEATTLSGVLRHIGAGVKTYGFDLSWSRVAYARNWLRKQGLTSTVLCTGSLFHIPFSDNSIDVVYTSHSMEPNGGNEEPILRELYRITKDYLVILEPGYELADDQARRRMDSHGYCKKLKQISDSLGYEVLEHKIFPVTLKPFNPTALTVIRKCKTMESPSYVLACPKFKTLLQEIGGMLFSPEALVVYPILGGIPCLRIENGIFASKYKEVMRAG